MAVLGIMVKALASGNSRIYSECQVNVHSNSTCKDHTDRRPTQITQEDILLESLGIGSSNSTERHW